MRPTSIAFIVWFVLLAMTFYLVAIALVMRKLTKLAILCGISGSALQPSPSEKLLLWSMVGFTLASGIAMRLYFLHLRKRRGWIGYCSTCGAHLCGDSRCMACGERQTLDKPRPRAFEVIVRRKSVSVPLHA